MARYYFVATALPPLQMGTPPEISFDELMFLLEVNLSSKDLEKVKILRRFYDVLNIRCMLKGDPFQSHGNMTQQQLDEALHGFNGVPQYIFDFLHKYDSAQERLQNFSELFSAYFKHESANAKGFLHEFLEFNHHWRLILAALRAKDLGRDLLKELQFEDPNDPIVAQLIVQKDASSIEPPDGFEDLKTLYEEHKDNPLGLMQALLNWNFYRIEDILGVDLFSIDRILGYMAQLSALEKWFELDKQKGLEFVDTLVKEPL